MLKYTIILLVFTTLALHSAAQYAETEGNVTVITDPRIERLALEYPRVAAQIHPIEGFRIQIFFDSGNFSKRNAEQARADFLRRFPDVGAYITFREPYYRVRIGDFRTKLEADGFRKRILRHYPHAFTVNDQINPPPVN